MGYAIRNKLTIGQYIDYKKSNFFTKEGKLNKTNLIPLLGNFYANAAHVFLFTYAFKFAKLGGLNQGVVGIMTIFASIFNSIIFYFYFGEVLSIIKIFGMMVAITAVIFLGVYSANKTGKVQDEERSQSFYAFVSLALALGVPIGFTLKHFLIKKYKGSYEYWFLPLDSGILENLFCSGFSIYHATHTGFTAKQLWLGAITGCL